ncbi:MAG: response regulator [Limnohabitans sp.]|nr:response regulator [Limnohabitans sp.]
MVTVPWHANANRYSALTYGFLCLFLLTTLGSVLYATYKDRETQLERYSQRVQGNALVYEDQITQTLQWVENMMRSLPEVASLSLLEAQPQTLTPLLQKLQYSQPALRSFSIYTEKEGIRASSNPLNLGVRLDLSSFDPLDHLPSENSVLRMGPGWQGRDLADGYPLRPGENLALDQPYFFPVMMRIGQGDKALLLVAALNPDFLLNRLERYNPANTELMVMQRLDGRVLMTTWESVAEAQAHTQMFIQRVQNEERGMIVGDWLSAFRASSRFPFFISVQVSQDQVLATWRQKTWTIGLAVMVGLFAVLGATVVLVRRIHRVETAERQYQQTILQYSQALEQSPSGILILDDRGRVVYCNAFWTQLSGFDEVHTLGRPPRILDPLHTPEQQVEHIWKKLRSGQLWRGEFVQPHKEGHSFTVVVLLAPMRNEEGETTHYICIQHDISGIKKMQSELQASRDKAEAATLAKSQFLANMSHEIRTPMNGLIGMTQFALDEPLPPEAQRYIANAHTSAVSLLGILNDILDFSKIEAGKLQLEWLPVSLDDLLSQVISLQSVAAQAKGLALTLDIEPEVPQQLMSDPVRLMQILNNLIGNAIKFTASGSVSVRVTLPAPSSPLLSTQPFISFEVRDTGVGMSDGQMTQLFKPFTQADNSTTRLFGGTGLGLAISRSLCQLLDGDLQISSELDRGTCVTMLLPLKKLVPVAQAPAPKMPQDALGRLAGAQVLLVEDHPMNRQLLQVLLAKLGIQTITAENGQQALDCLTQSPEQFDAVLMDVQMPVMDGIQATLQIRQDPRFASLPIIAVTANAMSDERESCFKAGMQDYLSKPVNRQALNEVLLRWI